MQPTEPNRSQILPPDLYRRTLTALRLVLPQPLIGDPYDTTDRDIGAMAEVASMRPANAEEAAMAVQVVATNALALDIMAVTTESPEDALKHWAASANMFRQSRGARSLLLRVQADRMKQARLAATVARGSGSETQCQDTETDVGHDSPMSPEMVPWDRPRPKPFVPDPEIIAQLVADEALMKRLTTPSLTRTGRHSTSPARNVPPREIISQIMGNETNVRRDSPALDLGSDAVPSGHPEPRSESRPQSTGIDSAVRRDSVAPDGVAPRSVSCYDISSQFSGNETAMRQRILASSTHTPPDIMRAHSAVGPSAAAPPFTGRPAHQGPYAASPFRPGS